MPDSTAKWQTEEADYRAIVNLSTRYDGVKNDGRRGVWLETTLESDGAQETLLQLGCNEEVWFFVNGQIVCVHKNYFGMPNAEPDGRCTLENATIRLSLKVGKNKLQIGLANYFYGWGLIALLADTTGLRFSAACY